MAHFSDLLRGVNSRLGFNADDPDRVDADTNWSFSFAGKPRKGMAVSFERKEEESTKNDARVKTEKTVAKMKIDHGECAQSFTFANDKQAADVNGTAYDEDGWKAKVGLAGEIKQAKSEWKVTGSLDVKSPDLGGAKAALAATVEQNQKSVTTVKPKLNLEISDEFNLGFSGVYESTLKELWAQVVYKPADSKNQFFFLRTDKTRQNASVGVDYKCAECDMTVSAEATYSQKDGFQGIKGQPVMVRLGSDWDLSAATSVQSNLTVADDYSMSNEISHAYDKNWTLSVSQSFDNSNVGSKESPYHVGFGISYKL